jgi:hypothetical protein
MPSRLAQRQFQLDGSECQHFSNINTWQRRYSAKHLTEFYDQICRVHELKVKKRKPGKSARFAKDKGEGGVTGEQNKNK